MQNTTLRLYTAALPAVLSDDSLSSPIKRKVRSCHCPAQHPHKSPHLTKSIPGDCKPDVICPVTLRSHLLLSLLPFQQNQPSAFLQVPQTHFHLSSLLLLSQLDRKVLYTVSKWLVLLPSSSIWSNVPFLGTPTLTILLKFVSHTPSLHFVILLSWLFFSLPRTYHLLTFCIQLLNFIFLISFKRAGVVA